MAKTNATNYPREPIGSYEQFGSRYNIFPLKTKCPTTEDCKGDVVRWDREYDAAMLLALLEVRSLFPPLEQRYRFASPVDLLERNVLFIWTVGAGKITHRETAFGSNEWLFSLAEDSPPELLPNPYFQVGSYRRSSPLEWQYVMSLDLENLCVISDRDEETQLFGIGKSPGLQELFTAGNLR